MLTKVKQYFHASNMEHVNVIEILNETGKHCLRDMEKCQ